MDKQYYNKNKKSPAQGQSPKTNTINDDFYNPYAFIPLSDKIYTLPEADQKVLVTCHDIPFEDGVSGQIEVCFKTMSPLCIRGQYEENVKMGDKYYIPATSIKGMIRNVFEIITLSDIRHGMADTRYSIRDMHSPDYQLKANNKPQKSGFLLQIKGKYYIIPCTSQKYTYKEIKEYKKVWLENKSMIAKYASLKNDYIFKTEDDDWCMWFFSGPMNNKKHEYLFTIPPLRETELIPLEEKEYQDFIFIHQKENENQAWQFWKNKLCNYNKTDDIIQNGYKGIIPCFFRTQIRDNHTIVRDLGFSFLYRQPYSKTLYDCLPKGYGQDDIDLAQAVFGYTTENSALKGRVQFTNTCLSSVNRGTKQTFILGSPKPTYYPFYLKQDKPGTLNTYSSTQASIAGWKRPLIYSHPKTGSLPPSKLTTSFIPLPTGIEFKVIIKIHNLRRFELGALLAAITFCNHPECFHSLGYAKVMGYGKLAVTGLQLQVTGNDLHSEKITEQEVFTAFKTKLFERTGMTEKEWNDYCSPLFKLTSGQYPVKPIRYPNLQSQEFKNIKNQKKSLRNFSPKIF